MRTYFDSSALLAAFVEEEEHHASATAALLDAADSFTCNHALAEIYGTLTSGRLDIQLIPRQAREMIEANVLDRLEVLELSVNDYRKAMVAGEAVGARGGAIFDMLHLQAARRGNARKIFTINVRHFQVFAPDLREIISLPDS